MASASEIVDSGISDLLNKIILAFFWNRFCFFLEKIYRYSEFSLLLVLKFLKCNFFMLQSEKESV